MTQEIYRLSANLDNPVFEGFQTDNSVRSVFGHEFPFDDFGTRTGGIRDWEIVPIGKRWVPRKVYGSVRAFNDYPCLDLSIPVFSERAVLVLRDLLEPNGELLPLDTKVGNYFAFNVVTKSTALILEKSEARYFDKTTLKVMRIDRFEFDESQLGNLAIFRLRELWNEVFVTDVFKDRVEQAGLNGFYFIKAWPYPPGVYWDEEETKRRKARTKTTGDLQGEALLLQLTFSGSAPPVELEKRVADYEEELSSLLSVQVTTSDPYIGMIETSERTKSEFRIFLSGPSVDRLYEFLTPWLSALDWPHAVKVTKRYGNIYDRKAKQVKSVLKK